MDPLPPAPATVSVEPRRGRQTPDHSPYISDHPSAARWRDSEPRRRVQVTTAIPQTSTALRSKVTVMLHPAAVAERASRSQAASSTQPSSTTETRKLGHEFHDCHAPERTRSFQKWHCHPYPFGTASLATNALLQKGRRAYPRRDACHCRHGRSPPAPGASPAPGSWNLFRALPTIGASVPNYLASCSGW